MLIRNGLEITGDIEINKQIYPLQWWLSPVDGAAHRLESGVSLVADPPVPDARLYVWKKNADGTYSTTAKSALTIAAELLAYKTNLASSVDAAVDRIYSTLIGNRGLEYLMSEQAALAFKAAFYAGIVPEPVQAWSDAKAQTSQWACDDILAAAANWRGAQASMRRNRLLYKEQVKAALAYTELDLVYSNWRAYLLAIRTTLGIGADIGV